MLLDRRVGGYVQWDTGQLSPIVIRSFRALPHMFFLESEHTLDWTGEIRGSWINYVHRNGSVILTWTDKDTTRQYNTFFPEPRHGTTKDRCTEHTHWRVTAGRQAVWLPDTIYCWGPSGQGYTKSHFLLTYLNEEDPRGETGHSKGYE